MGLEMVLNELSLRSPANDILTAQQWMEDLIDTLKVAAGHGVKKIVHVNRDLNDALLAPDYPLARWRNDSQVDIETRRFFRNLTTKQPFIPDLPEFWYLEDQAHGLGFAFQHEHLAISLRSGSNWYPSHVGLEVRYLELNDSSECSLRSQSEECMLFRIVRSTSIRNNIQDGELVTEHVEVTHASCSNHVFEHADWVKSRTQIETRDGSDIWNHKEELFPHLHFCSSTGVQIQNLLAGDPKLLYVKSKLLDLEEVCQDWQKQGGAFDLQKVPGKKKPESEATLHMFGQQRTFCCPDGEYRVFSLHVWITHDWRIHFFPIQEKQQIIIGYIGVHLPTKKYS